MSGDGERTVFKPNPGGRRPPPPSAPTPSGPAPAPAYNPANAPAYNTPAAPIPSAVPVSRTDDWIAARSSDRATVAGLPSAQDLNFDDLAAPNTNPLLRSAGPLLLLLGRLRIVALQASLASLMEQVASAINFYEKDIYAAGVAAEPAKTAKYLICATADDIVQNIPTDDRHVWTQYSMLSRFFGERIGGVRFFDELDRLLVDPAANYDLLELQHACLALGFQGKYRADPNGMSALQLRQRNLYETLRRIRARSTSPLSPRWKGQDLAASRGRLRVPVWVASSVLLLAALGLFLLLRTWLVTATEAVAAETKALHPETKIALQRRLPAPPPVIVPTAAQVGQVQRIKAAIGPDLGNCLTVDSDARWVVIRICNVALFDSGQAIVQPAFVPIAKRIGDILEKEPGPIRIVGHTDNVPLSAGSRFASNFALSVERAKAVAALVSQPLSHPERVATEGKGPDQPIAPNTTADGRAKNRRVELFVTKID